MKRNSVVALRMTLLTLVVTGLLYPLAMTGLARAVFPGASSGSLVERDRQVVGSRLIAQGFSTDRYFHPRPSSSEYDPRRSGASNLAPTSRRLLAQLAARRHAIIVRERLGSSTPIPVDMVTSSGSGLDPHISPAAARLQVSRVAAARNLSVETVDNLVTLHVENRQLGLLGEPRVNVLMLNLALDTLSSKGR